MPRSGQLLKVLGQKGLERLGFQPDIAQDILEEPEYLEETLLKEPMTFEELALELPETDQGLKVTPEFAVEHGLEEGEWYIQPDETSEWGGKIVPAGELPQEVELDVTEPTQFGPEDAVEMGWEWPDLPEGWKIEVSPETTPSPLMPGPISAEDMAGLTLAEPVGYRTSFVSPEGMKISAETGYMVTPEGEIYSPEDQENAQRFDELLGKVFPGGKVEGEVKENVFGLATTKPREFISLLHGMYHHKVAQEDTKEDIVSLLETFGLSEKAIGAIKELEDTDISADKLMNEIMEAEQYEHIERNFWGSVWHGIQKAVKTPLEAIDTYWATSVELAIASINGSEEDKRFVSRIREAIAEHGPGYMLSGDVKAAEAEWSTIPSWSKMVIKFGDPFLWLPVGPVIKPIKGLLGIKKAKPLKIAKSTSGSFIKGTPIENYGEHLQPPIATPAGDISVNIGGKAYKAYDMIPPEEWLAFQETAHPGRLGKSWWGRLKGKDAEWYADVKGAQLTSRYADSVGASAGDFWISQLDQIVDIEKALAVDKTGRVAKGILGVSADLPKAARLADGTPSFALNDVLEYYRFYNFADPRVSQWIKGADEVIDAVAAIAEKNHGVKIPKLYQYMTEFAHYFPRKVLGKGELERVATPGGARLSTKMGNMRSRVEELQELLIDAGYKYATPKESLKAYIHGMYRVMGNTEARKMLEVLAKPAGREMPKGKYLVVTAAEATRLKNQAIKLGEVLQRVRRGEKLHPSTARSLTKDYPDVMERIKGALKLSGKEQDDALKAILNDDVRPLIKGQRAEAATAVAERASFMKQASRAGFDEAVSRVPQGMIFEPQMVNGKVVSGAEISDTMNRLFSGHTNVVLRQLSDINRGLVALKASLDFSAPFIQGLYILGADVKNMLRLKPTFIWGEWFKANIQIAFQPKVLGAYRRANREIWAEAAQNGVIMADDLTDFYRGIRLIEKTIGVLTLGERIPLIAPAVKGIYGRLGIAFSGSGELARVQLYKSLKRPWVSAGGTLPELAEFTNLCTGVVSTSAMGVSANQRLAESAVLFAPRYLRANLMWMRMLAKRGIPANTARQITAGAAAGWTSAYVALAYGLGQEPKWKPWPKNLGGDGSEAFTVKIGERDMGPRGFPYSFIKATSGMIASLADAEARDNYLMPSRIVKLDLDSLLKEHPEIRGMFYKGAPMVGLTKELLTGRDAFGNRLEDGGDWAEALYENFLSISLSSILIDDPPADAQGFIAEVLGLGTIPDSDFETYDNAFNEVLETMSDEELNLDEDQLEKRAKDDLNSWDLTTPQKDKVKEKDAEMGEGNLQELEDKWKASQLRRGDDDYIAYKKDSKDYEDKYNAQEIAKVAKLRDVDLDYDIVDLQDSLKMLGAEKRGDWYRLEKTHAKILEEFDDDDQIATWRAYNEYYDTVWGPDSVDEAGDPIWKVVEAKRQAWMDKWGSEMWDRMVEIKENGYKDTDMLLFKIWDDKEALRDYWAIENPMGKPDKQRRLEYRQDPRNAEDEARLVFLGKVTTIENEDAEAVEEQVREWMQIYGIPEEKIPYFSKWLIPDEQMEYYGLKDKNIFKNYSNLTKENDKGEMVADSTARLTMRCGDAAFDSYLVDIKGFTPCYGTERCENLTKKVAAERLEELPPSEPVRMDLLTTEEIVNILSGKPARDWWEGVMWMFGGGEMDEEDARRILMQYGAMPDEIEKLLALLGSTYEGRTIDSLDQLVALVQQLSRTGKYIGDILAKVGAVAPVIEAEEYYRPETPTPTLTPEGMRAGLGS